MESLNGKTFTDFCGSEEEVMLPRNSIFKFGNIIKGKEFDTIELDIVDKPPLFRKVYDFRSEIKP